MELLSPGDLKRKRTELGLTQAQLADRAGVSQPLIARVESGSVDPKLSTFRDILMALSEAEKERLEAREIMHHEVIHVSPQDEVKRAVELMRRHGFSQLPVIEDGTPVGSVTEAEVVHRMNVEGQDVTSRRVEELMEEGFPTISPSTDLNVVSRILEHESALLVMDRGEVVGVVTNADVMRILE